jgi:hypothetical protein
MNESEARSTMFVVDTANRLAPMQRQAYVTEDNFQLLLANHPLLLSAAGGESGRLLLVRREAPVPASMDAGGRWSLDHLFPDPEGVPVLVEVKR